VDEQLGKIDRPLLTHYVASNIDGHY